jgi:hypothetical protein
MTEPNHDFQPQVQVKVVVKPEDTEPWDLTDPLNPQPNVYPVCAECKAPWHYSWTWLIGKTSTEKWCWTRPAGVARGCKHKGRPIVYDTRTSEYSVMSGSGGD